MNKKIVFIICDGLGDLPVPELGEKTPLEAAVTPIFDKLASKSVSGLVEPGKLQEIPPSDEAILSLFGYDLKTYYPGRGPFECLGTNADLQLGDVAFRANAGTIDTSGIIVDRRAGRISSTKELVDFLGPIEIDGIKFILQPGLAHRISLVMRGPNLSAKISDQDPHHTGEKPWEIKSLDNKPDSIFTASVLNKFNQFVIDKLKYWSFNEERIKNGQLPANIILFRGAGQLPQGFPTFKEKTGWHTSFAAGAPLYKGIAKAIKLDILDFDPADGVTGLPNSNISKKIEKALASLSDHDMTAIHIKATDSLAEDGNGQGKKEFIEKIDSAMAPFLEHDDILLAITADHTTACIKKSHSTEPVPLLIYGSALPADGTKRFTEKDCATGSLGLIQSINLMDKLKELDS